MIQIIPIPALKDNYIWMLLDTALQQAWVVDPGDAKPVIATLKKSNLTLKGILITHHHADHSGGINDLIDYANDVIVYASHLSPLNNITHRLKTGDTITCLATQFQAIEIPGHTLDHLAYYGNQSLFCGDTLFSVGCGRIFEGTPAQMYTSLNTLLKLPDQTKIYCGHEYTLANLRFAEHIDPNNEAIQKKITWAKESLTNHGCTLPSILHEEKMTNPFLRCDDEAIIKAVEKHGNKKLNNPVEVFHQLREWKNHFN